MGKNTWTVTVEEKVQKDYVVEARSRNDAIFTASKMEEPTSTAVLTTRVAKVVPSIPEESS